MHTIKVFDGSEEIAASGSLESAVIDLNALVQKGFFSLQIELTGDGTGKFEYMVSNNGKDYITQTDSADVIVSSFTSTSGPGADGKDLISFEPEPAAKLKIICTETGGVNSITPKATLNVI